MFRQAISQTLPTLRQRATNQITQQIRPTPSGVTARRFTTTTGSAVEEKAAQETLTKNNEHLVDDFANLKPIDGPFVKPTNNAAEKAAATEEFSATTKVLDKLNPEKSSDNITKAATDNTISNATNNNGTVTQFGELPPFIQQQVAGNRGGSSKFFMQEYHSGPDGKGFTSTYKGTFDPKKGLEVKHTSMNHEKGQDPAVTTKLFRSTPTKDPKEVPQITSSTIENDVVKLGNGYTKEGTAATGENGVLTDKLQFKNNNPLKRRSEESDLEAFMESELDHPFTRHPFFNDRFGDIERIFNRRMNPFFDEEFGRHFGTNGRRFNRQQRRNDENSDLEGFLDDFFAPRGYFSKPRQLQNQQNQQQAQQQLTNGTEQRLQQNGVQQQQQQVQNDAIQQTKANKQSEYEDPFDLLDDLLGSGVTRSLFGRRYRNHNPPHAQQQQQTQQAQRTAQQQSSNQQAQAPVQQVVHHHHHAPAPQQQQQTQAQQAASHVPTPLPQQPPQQPQQQAQQFAQQQQAQQFAQQQQAQQQQAQQQAQQYQHHVTPHVQKHPTYYDPQHGFTQDGYNQWVNGFHADKSRFNDMNEKLHHITRRLREQKRAQRAQQRQQHRQQQHERDLIDFFNQPFGDFHHPMAQTGGFAHPGFRPFSNFSMFPGFGRHGGFYGF